MYKLFLVVVNHIRLRVWATAIVSWSKQNHRRRPDYRSTVKINRVSKKWSRRRLTRRAAGWERQCHGWRGRFRRPSPPPWDAPAMSWWALSAVGRRGGDSIWVRRRRRKTDGRSLHKDGTTTASWKAGGIAGSFAPSSPFLPALSCLAARPRAMRMYLRDANPKPDKRYKSKTRYRIPNVLDSDSSCSLVPDLFPPQADPAHPLRTVDPAVHSRPIRQSWCGFPYGCFVHSISRRWSVLREE